MEIKSKYYSNVSLFLEQWEPAVDLRDRQEAV